MYIYIFIVPACPLIEVINVLFNARLRFYCRTNKKLFIFNLLLGSIYFCLHVKKLRVNFIFHTQLNDIGHRSNNFLQKKGYISSLLTSQRIFKVILRVKRIATSTKAVNHFI